MTTCSECGKEFKDGRGLNLHALTHKGGNVAVAEKPIPGQQRSERGKRRYTEALLTPLEQIRMQPTNTTGAWAYYLRPDGATIRDALIAYPNGGVPDIDDKRLRDKYGTNAEYYRERNRAKGFTYLGQVLDERAMKLLVECLVRNREDEVLFCEDELATCEFNRVNNDSQREREIAAKRKAQFQRRLDTVLAPFDADKLLDELKEISRAQMLANVDPKVLRVMRAMIGEVNEKLAGMVTRFQSGKHRESDPEMTGVSATASRGDSGADFGEGVKFIDA